MGQRVKVFPMKLERMNATKEVQREYKREAVKLVR
ncbi:hypothetical protein AGR6A_Lc100071 [Agrobacterium sp. NCPPB 925]|nr:hypothetical protein AGR6A_Lc100071 [Agrobacterium sp. NCPPB 925]